MYNLKSGKELWRTVTPQRNFQEGPFLHFPNSFTEEAMTEKENKLHKLKMLKISVPDSWKLCSFSLNGFSSVYFLSLEIICLMSPNKHYQWTKIAKNKNKNTYFFFL